MVSEKKATATTDRRSVLSSIGAGAGALIGLKTLTGTARAWQRFDVCFRGCSEVWMIVAETDIDLGGPNAPPPVAHVIVASNGDVTCEPVEFTAANVTTIPGQFGDSPVVKYDVGSGQKILGVIEYNYNPDDPFADPTWCVFVNENTCATTPNTPDVFSAPCLPDSIGACPAGDFCSGTGGGPPGDTPGNGPPENGPGNGPPDESPGNGPPDESPGQSKNVSKNSPDEGSTGNSSADSSGNASSSGNSSGDQQESESSGNGPPDDDRPENSPSADGSGGKDDRTSTVDGGGERPRRSFSGLLPFLGWG